MEDGLALLIVGLPFGSWFVAAGSWLGLVLFFPLPGRGFVWYALRGYAAFSRHNFAPEGAMLHTIMLASMAVFASCVGLGLLLGQGR